jgi:hypothetical protein
LWYSYDQENRTLVHHGTLSNGQVMMAPQGNGFETSFIHQYDANGQMIRLFSPGSVLNQTTPTIVSQSTLSCLAQKINIVVSLFQ